jgi:hypothetical protein
LKAKFCFVPSKRELKGQPEAGKFKYVNHFLNIPQLNMEMHGMSKVGMGPNQSGI